MTIAGQDVVVDAMIPSRISVPIYFAQVLLPHRARIRINSNPSFGAMPRSRWNFSLFSTSVALRGSQMQFAV